MRKSISYAKLYQQHRDRKNQKQKKSSPFVNSTPSLSHIVSSCTTEMSCVAGLCASDTKIFKKQIMEYTKIDEKSLPNFALFRLSLLPYEKGGCNFFLPIQICSGTVQFLIDKGKIVNMEHLENFLSINMKDLIHYFCFVFSSSSSSSTSSSLLSSDETIEIFASLKTRSENKNWRKKLNYEKLAEWFVEESTRSQKQITKLCKTSKEIQDISYRKLGYSPHVLVKTTKDEKHRQIRLQFLQKMDYLFPFLGPISRTCYLDARNQGKKIVNITSILNERFTTRKLFGDQRYQDIVYVDLGWNDLSCVNMQDLGDALRGKVSCLGLEQITISSRYIKSLVIMLWSLAFAQNFYHLELSFNFLSEKIFTDIIGTFNWKSICHKIRWQGSVPLDSRLTV